jgi:hypothetical protein
MDKDIIFDENTNPKLFDKRKEIDEFDYEE